MLCIWWGWKGIVYYELLPENHTINSEKYCSELSELTRAVDQKRPELVDNVFFYNLAGMFWSIHCMHSPDFYSDRFKTV